jgi:hypothetical protein
VGGDEATPQIVELLIDTLILSIDLGDELLMLGLELKDGGNQLLGGPAMQLVLSDESGCWRGRGHHRPRWLLKAQFGVG